MRKTLLLLAGAFLLASQAHAAKTPIASVEALPAPVRTLYETLCAPDYWAGGQRVLDGSTADSIGGGSAAYLVVCGDAASSTPYSVIVTTPDGAASEAKFNWVLQGNAVDKSGLGNAAFGRAPGTIVTHAHVSATCETAYTHRWDGAAFQLVDLDRRGCKRGE
jgi:hypothetical protein